MDYANSSVRMIHTMKSSFPENYQAEDIEAYLTEELGYRLKDIDYMYSVDMKIELG